MSAFNLLATGRCRGGGVGELIVADRTIEMLDNSISRAVTNEISLFIIVKIASKKKQTPQKK